MKTRVTRVLVVDPSPVAQEALASTLNRHPQIDVVAMVDDVYAARDAILTQEPDVMVLEPSLGPINGLAFLSKLTTHHPIPTVVLDNGQSANLGAQATQAGSTAVFPKAEVFRTVPTPDRLARLVVHIDTEERRRARVRGPGSAALLAIGASAGGTRTLETLLGGLPPHVPGIVITQHMPEGFTAVFAKTLTKATGLDVREGWPGTEIVPGRVLIAPAGHHMIIERRGASLVTDVHQGPRVSGHRPSVNVMMHSVAREAGGRAIGLILTGMGDDGAEGLLAMRDAGATTLAQDEATSAVYGMPKAAVEHGAVQRVLSLDAMPTALLRLFDRA